MRDRDDSLDEPAVRFDRVSLSYGPETDVLSDVSINLKPGSMTFLVRTRTEPSALAGSVTREIAAVAPELPVYDMRTMQERLADSVGVQRIAAAVMRALAALAFVLAVSGLYGVLAYLVALRRKEIGIRMALGATGTAIVGLVVRQSARLAVVGVVVGSLMAIGASKFISTRLPLIPAFDAVALFGAMAIVLLAALGAAYVPSRRAAEVNPVDCLKT